MHRAETPSARGRQGGMEIIYCCDEITCKVTHLCAAATNTINTEYKKLQYTMHAKLFQDPSIRFTLINI